MSEKQQSCTYDTVLKSCPNNSLITLYRIWKVASVDEWLYNDDPYKLIVLHLLFGVACYWNNNFISDSLVYSSHLV
jgi:hypothetical protein